MCFVPFSLGTPTGRVAGLWGISNVTGMYKTGRGGWETWFENVGNYVREIDWSWYFKGCKSLTNSENIDPDAP